MPTPDFALGALIAAVIVGLTAALLMEREAHRRDVAEFSRRLEEQAGRLSALERVERNPLYREALEDQRARELRAADSVSVGVEHMLNALRILAPEMLRKDKKK